MRLIEQGSDAALRSVLDIWESTPLNEDEFSTTEFRDAIESLFDGALSGSDDAESASAKADRREKLYELRETLYRRFSGLNEKIAAIQRIETAQRDRLRIVECLAANIDCGVFRFRREFDGAFRVEYCSDRTWKLMGLFSRKDKIDLKDFPALCLAADRQRFLDAARTAFSEKRSLVWEGEAIIEGRVRFLRIKMARDSGAADALVYDGTMEDITEERDEKEKLKSLLEAVDQLSGHIVGFRKVVREPAAREADLVFQNLSAREAQVAHLILQGLSNKEIADRLFISESTTKKHLTRIFDKLDIGSRGELFHRARRIS